MHKNLLKKKIKKAGFAVLLMGSISLNAQQNALSFDGSNDYIQTTFPGVLGNAPRTVEAWINLPISATGENLVTSWGSDSVNGGRFTIRINNLSGAYKLRIENKGGGVNGNITLNDGNWHHIAVTYDNSLSTNKYKLYVDGNLDAQGDISTATNTISSTSMIIGRRINPSFGGYFTGSIDEVRIWSVARTAAEIQANKNIEFCTAPTSLAAYFKFNEGVANANNSSVSSVTSVAGGFTGAFNNFALDGTSSNFIAGPSAVTAVNINNNVTLSGNTLTAVQTGATYEWVDCNNGNAPVGITTQSFTPAVAGNYAVNITLAGCTVTSACQALNLSVKDIETLSSVTVSPNPAADFVKISAKNKIEKIEILNLAGQRMMMLQPNSNDTVINISELKEGVYLLKTTAKEQSQVYKIIKK